MLSGLNAGNQVTESWPARGRGPCFNAVRLERRKSGLPRREGRELAFQASMLSGLNAGNQGRIEAEIEAIYIASMLSGLNAGNQVRWRLGPRPLGHASMLSGLNAGNQGLPWLHGRADLGPLQCCPA